MSHTPALITRSQERGHTKISWLDSRHSFSFGEFHDRARMGFGPLRVFNDDRVAPRGGFPPHPHRDMEIVSIVLEGKLQVAGHVLATGDSLALEDAANITMKNHAQAEESARILLFDLPLS